MTPAAQVYALDAAKADRLLGGLIELEKDIGTPDGVRRLDTCRSLLMLNVADAASRHTAKTLAATCRRCGGAGAKVGCGACGSTGKAPAAAVSGHRDDPDDDERDTDLAEPEKPAVTPATVERGGEG